MAFLSETFHLRRLTECGVTIRTTYIANGKLVSRNTDGTQDEDVLQGIRCKKEYFLQGKPVHVETLFDSRIEYTYRSDEMEETLHSCANCGFTGALKDFAEGCPCCDAASNLDYTEKELGSKHHYDLVLKKPFYRIVTALLDLVISMLLSFGYIVKNSRTFNAYDISKGLLFGLILAMLLYYFFYLCDAYLILGPIKRYKERRNRRQMEFWRRTGIDKKQFFNNLNYEVGKKYYSQPDIIDYDIIDYVDFRESEQDGVMCVEVSLEVRKVYLRRNHISSKYGKDKIILRKNDHVIKLKPGINLIKCPNCNSNIDVTKGICDYCGTVPGGVQAWTIVPVIDRLT